MAVETYSWRSQLGAGAIEYSQTVRAAQFGDGYEQVADNGINSTAIQVPMKHTGNESEVDRIRDFLLAHTVKAFIITPPGEEKGLYRVVADSIRKTQISSKVAELTFTIKRAYGVYA
ncbi:phage tail protein [Enterobacter hormaechei]|uniref:phage tail protein n=1 Tax=Enterobacter hormaechei TaxID=158836 RepID=UPI0018671C76|nr:phage tail protein [Enterobacter hormaechei]ELI6761594.1 phage tail protein [Enterobacter hormaechei subsp. xiangfangensis]ELX7458544.1 phage tail protein [Enterobacter hormaechei subsp. hoffmannii]ELD4168524.1 phage tail protein [Enterobacter hormaechei]ELT0904897.1 phage tail protein [Enterobacter hormaechei subsp. xiangfangensis]ELT4016146.1 phage tail protein [Enterobacter hormaechei subsp. xiangfangensis]